MAVKKTTKKRKRKVGRPSKYNKKYCQQIIDYFDIEPYKEVDITTTNKDGSMVKKTELRANDMRFLFEFAKSIDVNQDTLHEWKENHPEFSEALKTAKELQKRMLVVNGLHGNYASSFAIFSAKNMIGWRDSQDINVKGDLKVKLKMPDDLDESKF